MPKRRNRMRVPWFMSLPYLAWTITCLGLLVVGAFLEASIADAHRIRIEDIGSHFDTSPLVPRFLLGGAVVCGVWPAASEAWRALRRKRVSWQLLALVIIAGASGFGHFFEAATMSLVLSLAMNFSMRRAAARTAASHPVNR